MNLSICIITKNEEQNIDRCLKAVSYTHLDVYKRQLYKGAYCREKTIIKSV